MRSRLGSCIADVRPRSLFPPRARKVDRGSIVGKGPHVRAWTTTDRFRMRAVPMPVIRLAILLFLLLGFGDSVSAKDAVGGVSAAKVAATTPNMDLVWALLAGPLVMFMQAGFALLETGLTRAKNAANTMAMNLTMYALAVLGFWALGFAFQMGGSGLDGFGSMIGLPFLGRSLGVCGLQGFLLAGKGDEPSVLALFLLQAVFLATAATIPTGALAERWRFASFVGFGLFISMFLYPVYACWVWGGGWLADLGASFGIGNGHVDFAGASVVHMTGGLSALAGAIVLGPRIGKFRRDRTARAIPGHNVPMVALGTFVLAFGWFGFNCGGAFRAHDVGLARVAVSTMLATASGCCSALVAMWLIYGKPDPTMACNGLLAGAVAISAGCAFVTPLSAVVIGLMAGLLVIGSILFVERVLCLDDPVGAVSVHGVGGAFGCLCVGLFADGRHGKGWNGVSGGPLGLFHGGDTGQLLANMIGVAVNILWVFPVAWLFFKVMDWTLGNRVSAQAEIVGLDVAEMGVAGYVQEDPIEVQRAGLEHLAEHGPGVPRKVGAPAADESRSRP